MAHCRTESLSLIQDLVSFDTTSAKSNLELVQFVEHYLESAGIRSTLVFNEGKTKANLYATIGPCDTAGVLLSGHTDVVSVAGQNWDTDPFSVEQKDGALFGRGTADMKSFIACVLGFVPEFVEANLLRPIHLAFSYDEEIGCVGVRRLLTMMQDLPIRPEMCIVGEPTSMQVVNSHKGKRAQRVTVTGLEAHSSLPNTGVNAIEYAARLIVRIRQLADELASTGPSEDGFEVPHSTLQIGVVAGGTALNIVPNSCVFDFEMRNVPSHDPESILRKIWAYAENVLEPEMTKVDSGCKIEFENLSGYPGMFTEANSEVIAFVKMLTGETESRKVSFGTEGGLFSERLGIPTVVCGPGSIEQAHKPNEYIELDQVRKMETFMCRLLRALESD